MSVIEFFKPTKSKLITFLIIAILANIPFIGYFIIMTSCPPPIFCLNFVHKFNPLLNPIFFLWGGEDDTPIATYSHSGTGNTYYILMVINFVYWYLLSCVLVFIYKKFRKNKTRALKL